MLWRQGPCTRSIEITMTLVMSWVNPCATTWRAGYSTSPPSWLTLSRTDLELLRQPAETTLAEKVPAHVRISDDDTSYGSISV